MKVIDVVPGSVEWRQAKLGIPSASNFHRIITPKEHKPSKAARAYLYELMGERLTGIPADYGSTEMMMRGGSMEERAIRAYEIARDVNTTAVGFCTTDDGAYGCSPDRLVGDDGMLQVKVLSLKEHMAALMGEKDEEHKLQVQGELLVTGRKWSEVIFFHPTLPWHIVKFTPDAEVQKALHENVSKFSEALAFAIAEFRKQYLNAADVVVEQAAKQVTKEATKPAAPQPAPEKGIAEKPREAFLKTAKEWVGADGAPVVSAKSATNMRLFISGLLKHDISSSTKLSDEQWQEATNELVYWTKAGGLTPSNWKEWCETRMKAVAAKDMKKLEEEHNLTLSDFEPVATDVPVTVEAFVRLAEKARTKVGFPDSTNRSFYATKDGKTFCVDSHTIKAAGLPVEVTRLDTLAQDKLEALFEKLEAFVNG